VVGTVGTGIGLLRARRAERAANDAAARAEAINEFLLGTLGAANPVEGQSRSVTLLDALRGAEGRLGSAFERQPEVEASVRASIGITYERLGFYADAERLLRSALEVGARTSRFTVRDRLSPQVALGVVLHDQGKLAEAEKMYRQALETAGGLSDPKALSDVTSNLALVLFDEGDYVSAEPLAREVLAADQRELRPDDPNLAVSLNNLGRILRAEQKGEEALALYRQADANLAKARHPFRATFLGNIGQLECERGNIDVALPAFSEGLALGSELLGERHADVVTIREKLGRCLVQHRRYDEAERALLAVFNAWDVSFGASPERRQRATRAVVDLYEAWGKPDKAREWRAKLATQASPEPRPAEARTAAEPRR